METYIVTKLTGDEKKVQGALRSIRGQIHLVDKAAHGANDDLHVSDIVLHKGCEFPTYTDEDIAQVSVVHDLVMTRSKYLAQEGKRRRAETVVVIKITETVIAEGVEVVVTHPSAIPGKADLRHKYWSHSLQTRASMYERVNKFVTGQTERFQKQGYKVSVEYS